LAFLRKRAALGRCFFIFSFVERFRHLLRFCSKLEEDKVVSRLGIGVKIVSYFLLVELDSRRSVFVHFVREVESYCTFVYGNFSTTKVPNYLIEKRNDKALSRLTFSSQSLLRLNPYLQSNPRTFLLPGFEVRRLESAEKPIITITPHVCSSFYLLKSFRSTLNLNNPHTDRYSAIARIYQKLKDVKEQKSYFSLRPMDSIDVFDIVKLVD
jgi:hypothetical protein